MAAAQPRLGVLGGSFDPPHVAHLAIASEACHDFGLERVLFVPAAAPPHKGVGERTSAAVRLELTSLAIDDDLRFTASGVEIERDLVYTVDTLRALERRATPGHDLVFIMGSDSLLQLETWHEPEELLSLCSLAVAPRPGDAPEAIAAAAARWGDDQVVAARRAAAGRRRRRTSATASPRAGPSATWCRTAWSSTSTRRGCTGDGHRPGGGRGAHRRAAVSDGGATHAHRVAARGRGRWRSGSAPPRETAELAGLLHDYCRELSDERDRWRRPPATASRSARSRRAGPGRSCTARSPPPSSPSCGLDREVAAAIRLHTVGAAGMTRAREVPVPRRLSASRAATSRASTRCARWRTTSLDARRRRRRAPEPARHHRPWPRGGPRGTRVVQRDSCRRLRDTAATACAAGAARRSSARRRGCSTCSRRRSPSPRCSAPGTSPAASPGTSRSPRRAATSRPSSSRRPARTTPVAALLVVQDPAGGDPGVYVVPPDLLLEGPNGEYVFAADAMADRHAGRRTSAAWSTRRSTRSTRVPVSDLGTLGRRRRSCRSTLERPVARRRRTATRRWSRTATPSPSSDLPAIFADAGTDRRDIDRPAGRAGQVRARGGRPAARPASAPPLAAREPVAAGRTGALGGPRPASPRGSAVVEQFPADTQGRRGAVRLPARRRGDPGRHHAAVARLPRRRDRAGAQRQRQGRRGRGGRRAPRQPRREPADAAQRGQLLVQADADPGGRRHPPGGPRHPCYTRPRRRPRRPRACPRGPSRSSSATTSRHRNPAQRTSRSRSPRTHDLRTPGARHRRARRRQEGAGHRRPQHGRGRVVHRLLRGRQRRQHAPDEGHRRRDPARSSAPIAVPLVWRGSARASGSSSTSSTSSCTCSRRRPATSTGSRRCGATSPGSTCRGRGERPHARKGPESPSHGEVHHEAQTHGRGADRAVHAAGRRGGPGARLRPLGQRGRRCCGWSTTPAPAAACTPSGSRRSLDRAALAHSRDMIASRLLRTFVALRRHGGRAGAQRGLLRQRLLAVVGRRGDRLGQCPCEARREAVFKAWMHSSSHRQVILAKRWRDVGIGCARGTLQGPLGRGHVHGRFRAARAVAGAAPDARPALVRHAPIR